MKHVRAILALPFIVTIVIPTLILSKSGTDPFGLWQSLAARVALSTAGGLLIGVGLTMMFTTIRWFATVGQGTLAPWNPPRRLVVKGVYRYVRNPMISGALAILLGESLLSASPPLAKWFLAFAIINAIYIPFSEEPGLAKRLGDDYRLLWRIGGSKPGFLGTWPAGSPGTRDATLGL